MRIRHQGDAKRGKRIYPWLFAVALLMILVSCSPTTSGTFRDYYVNTTGTDASGRGSTVDRPWRTIQYALDNADYSGSGRVRIYVAAGSYVENLAINRPVIIIGAGSGDPLTDSGVTVIEPATIPSEPIDPAHTISGGGRVELFALVFKYGRLQATRGTLYVENVWFWWVQGRYGLRLRDVGAFNIVESEFRTRTDYYADHALEIGNSIGEIHGGYFGDQFDHTIDITRYEPGTSDARVDGYEYRNAVSHVTIDGVTIKGSNVFFADGIRVAYEATAIIRNSQILREHPDAEAWIPDTSDGSAAGIDLLYEKVGNSASTVTITGNTIAGFDTGIAMNMGGKRVIAADNDISGVSYPVKIHDGRTARLAKADARIDFGGGPGGSTGGNIFRNVGAYAFFHQKSYDVFACFNDWEVPTSQIENRIYDQLDDPALGRVFWEACSTASEPIIAESPTLGTPELVQIWTNTLIPTPTSSVTATPAPALLTFIKNAFCRKGPGVKYFDVTAFEQGKSVTPVARNEGEPRWWWVAIPNSNERCWVSDTTVEKSGPVEELPVQTAPPLPATPGSFGIVNRMCTPNGYSLQLGWQASENATGYRLYLDGELLATLNANQLTYEHKPPTGVVLTYTLEAFNEYGLAESLSLQDSCTP